MRGIPSSLPSHAVALSLTAVLWLGGPVTGGAQVPTETTPPETSETASADEFEEIDGSACVGCHEETRHGSSLQADLEHSAHEGLGCLDCHATLGTMPHQETDIVAAADQACRDCHGDADEQYQAHGRAAIGADRDMPLCHDCHGSHHVLPSSAKASKTHPVNLPATCGRCHEDLNLTTRHDILIDHPIQIYESSVHGKATKGGIYVAATCNDCHSTGASAHRIYSPGHPDSAINHFNIPHTCGRCHTGVEADFREGIHGQLVERGETDAPVCTNCHGEHGIVSPSDPQSPVSRSRVAEETCSPCHESAVLNEKYGLRAGRLTSFIDSYHGLKSRAGDTHVANCASCHGVHRILPSSDSTSTIHPDNLQRTCGECHPGISRELAAEPIHGISGQGLQTSAADIVEKIYIVAIVVIIGLMVLHWLIDLTRQLKNLFGKRPQVRRMYPSEVWQHTFLMVTFVALVISGFALRFGESGLTQLFFGWEGGFELRGVVHRFAAVFFILTVVWHTLYLVLGRRGRRFFRDMWPVRRDFTQFGQQILYNLGRRPQRPAFGRFSYVEKAEYWALIWGSAIMVVTGLLLWFDNWVVQFLPKGILDVSLVIHYYEAWLATLAILVWHMYSTVFSPQVYPMNPSWLTGMMPEQMYRHEHPEHFEQGRKETEEYLRKEMELLSPDPAEPSGPSTPDD
jgi:cytochrome b subunit of formate dehydrogenase